MGLGCNRGNHVIAPDMAVCMVVPVLGAPDSHCNDVFITADPAACMPDGGIDDAPDGGGSGDYGATMYNGSGYDDDCKYSVSYSVYGACHGADSYFVVTVKDALTSRPVGQSMDVRADVFLTDSHTADSSAATTVELSDGVYKIGPVKLDTPGQWTVRFHFFESCVDVPASPHGHAAFFFNVPS